MRKDRIRPECNVSNRVKGSAKEEIICATDEMPIVRLSADDQCALAEAIIDPPSPAPALTRAAEAYSTLVTKQ